MTRQIPWRRHARRLAWQGDAAHAARQAGVAVARQRGGVTWRRKRRRVAAAKTEPATRREGGGAGWATQAGAGDARERGRWRPCNLAAQLAFGVSSGNCFDKREA